MSFHGAALPPMELVPACATDGETRPAGRGAIHGHGSHHGAGSNGDAALAAGAARARAKKHPNYTAVFADELIALAADDRRIVAHHRRHADRDRAGEVPGGVSRIGSSTSASPSSTP